MNRFNGFCMKKLFLNSGGLRTEKRLDAFRKNVDLFLGSVDEVLFIPYAVKDHAANTQRMKDLSLLGRRAIKSIDEFSDPINAIENAMAIFVGGGNTFRLLHVMQSKSLLNVIRSRVYDSMPYIGVSAGTNLACPSIQTTNDMPIVLPAGLQALGLVHFQINAHYFDGKIFYQEDACLVPYGGETRADRLNEFLEENSKTVLALYEGSSLKVLGDEYTLYGQAKVFARGQEPVFYESSNQLKL